MKIVLDFSSVLHTLAFFKALSAGFLDLFFNFDLGLQLLEAGLVFLTPTNELPQLPALLVLGVRLLLLLLEDKLKPGLLLAHLLEFLGIVLVLVIKHASCVRKSGPSTKRRATLSSLTPEGRAVVHKLLGVEDKHARLKSSSSSKAACLSCPPMLSRLYWRIFRPAAASHTQRPVDLAIEDRLKEVGFALLGEDKVLEDSACSIRLFPDDYLELRVARQRQLGEAEDHIELWPAYRTWTGHQN